ncbi:hypothetical protein OAV21_02935 [bacterium]|jgi:hypothetical protein|nr:hypothetical protein [bacterium]
MNRIDLDSRGIGQALPPESRMHPTSSLHACLDHVDRRVGRANTAIIQHPAELRIFEGLTPSELSAAAARHDLRIVRRMVGGQLECTRLAMA